MVVAPGPALEIGRADGVRARHLAGYKVPRSVVFADEIPKTGSGKILKRSCASRSGADARREWASTFGMAQRVEAAWNLLI